MANNIKIDKTKETLIGSIATIVFSKEILASNKEVASFVEQLFNIHYKLYVIRSRTLIFARLTKDILLMDGIDYKVIGNKIIEYFDISNDFKYKRIKKSSLSDWMN